MAQKKDNSNLQQRKQFCGKKAFYQMPLRLTVKSLTLADMANK